MNATRESRSWTLALAVVLIAGACRAALGAASPLSEERIDALAAMLPERPSGFGRPIADRAAWEGLARLPAFAGVVPRAEALLKQPIPPQPDELYLDFSRTGNRTRWQRVAWRRRSRLKDLALAECLEAKGRFLPAIEQTIEALCAERTWVMPAHDGGLANFKGERIDIDLGSSQLAWSLATVDYLLGDRLRARTRRLLRENVRRRVLDPFRDMVNGGRKANWWLRTTNNWNAVCLAGVTGTALAQVESRRERAFYVAAAEQYSMNYLHGFTPDGYCSEGLGYWNYGFGHYVLLAEAIYQATGGRLDLMARPEARAPAAFGARIEIINGVYPAFADCSVRTRPGSRIMWYVNRRLGLGLQEARPAQVVSPGGSLPEALAYSFPNSASMGARLPAGRVNDVLRSWFEDAGVLVARPRPGSTCRMGVALKGGHNAEHHNHNDVGSFVAVVGSQAVLLDPGSEVYTARTFSSHRYESKVINSYGHSVPVVAGRLQATGRKAAARVLRAGFTDEADTLALDLASAYPVPELKSLTRTFVYSRKGPGSLTVRDEVEFSSPQQFGTALITLGRWQPLGPNALTVYDTEEAVRVDLKVIGAGYTLTSGLIDENVTAPAKPLRIGIDLKQPVKHAVIEAVITPMPAPATSGNVVPRNGGFEEGSWAWSLGHNGMGSVSSEQAAGGQASLKVVDRSTTDGSDISSARMRIARPGRFELRGKVFPVSGSGLGIYVRYLDEAGNLLNMPRNARGWIDPVTVLGGADRRWKRFKAAFEAPPGTMYLQVWIHSMTSARVEAYLDELEIAPAPAR